MEVDDWIPYGTITVMGNPRRFRIVQNYRCALCGDEWSSTFVPSRTDEDEEVEHAMTTGCKGRVERSR